MHYTRIPCDTYTKVMHTMKYDILDLDPPIRYMVSNKLDFVRETNDESGTDVYLDDTKEHVNELINDCSISDDDRHMFMYVLYYVSAVDSRADLFGSVVDDDEFDDDTAQEHANKMITNVIDKSRQVKQILIDVLTAVIHVPHPEYLDLEDIIESVYDDLMELHRTLSTYNRYIRVWYELLRNVDSEQNSGAFMHCHAIKHITNTIEKTIKQCGRCKIPTQPYALYVHRNIYDPKKDMYELITQKYSARYLILPEPRVRLNRLGVLTVVDRSNMRNCYGSRWWMVINFFESENDMSHIDYTPYDEDDDDPDDGIYEYDPPDPEPEEEVPEEEVPDNDRYDRHNEHNDTDPQHRSTFRFGTHAQPRTPANVQTEEEDNDERNNNVEIRRGHTPSTTRTPRRRIRNLPYD